MQKREATVGTKFIKGGVKYVFIKAEACCRECPFNEDSEGCKYIAQKYGPCRDKKQPKLR